MAMYICVWGCWGGEKGAVEAYRGAVLLVE